MSCEPEIVFVNSNFNHCGTLLSIPEEVEEPYIINCSLEAEAALLFQSSFENQSCIYTIYIMNEPFETFCVVLLLNKPGVTI